VILRLMLKDNASIAANAQRPKPICSSRSNPAPRTIYRSKSSADNYNSFQKSFNKISVASQDLSPETLIFSKTPGTAPDIGSYVEERLEQTMNEKDRRSLPSIRVRRCAIGRTK
jgi:hypothetical protein